MRQIIIIDTKRMQYANGPDDIILRAAFWYPVPVGSESPLGAQAGITKVASATPAEIAALQDGTVIEYIYTTTFSLGATGPQIRASLIAAYNAVTLPESPRPNPTRYNGASWDGSTWTLP